MAIIHCLTKDYWSFSFLLYLAIAAVTQSFLTGVQGESIGVCYGRVANNLPPPPEVAAMFKSHGITKMRMFDADPTVIAAFANSNITLMVGVPNEELPALAVNPEVAKQWFHNNIIPHLPATSIKYISVGNEIFPDTPYIQYLLPAMKNLYAAIRSWNLQDQIKVSTTHKSSVLGNSYPPSSGVFNPHIKETMKSILDFLAETKSPFMANVYPYFAHVSNPNDVPLNYALFQNGKPTKDGALVYNNLFDAMVDSLVSAMEALGHGDIPIIITETGWPSQGNDAATVGNALTYNNNCCKHVLSGAGTPKRPGRIMETFIFAMFNENLKGGDVTERYFGLFYPGKTQVYPMKFAA